MQVHLHTQQVFLHKLGVDTLRDGIDKYILTSSSTGEQKLLEGFLIWMTFKYLLNGKAV